jgi:hypothetical protein
VEKGKAEVGDVVGKPWKQSRRGMVMVVILIHLLSALGDGHGNWIESFLIVTSY